MTGQNEQPATPRGKEFPTDSQALDDHLNLSYADWLRGEPRLVPKYVPDFTKSPNYDYVISNNKVMQPIADEAIDLKGPTTLVKKPRGRPKGSKNKPKERSDPSGGSAAVIAPAVAQSVSAIADLGSDITKAIAGRPVEAKLARASKKARRAAARDFRKFKRRMKRGKFPQMSEEALWEYVTASL